MPQFATPQDAEDAFYDAIDENDLSAMLAVWEDSDDVICLLPMQPLVRGRNRLRDTWGPLLQGDFDVDIEVLHVHWIETGDLAVHYLEEKAKIAGQQQQPPVYATNMYRRGNDGWRMILHQNSPVPPPPGMMPGMPQM